MALHIDSLQPRTTLRTFQIYQNRRYMALPADRPNGKHYILAAFAATLVVAVVVTVVLVVMRPPHIRFSITRVGHRVITRHGGVQLILSLTLAANNTSRRATVKYQSMIVDVSRTQRVNSISADVMTGMPLRQPTGNLTTFDAVVDLPWGASRDASTDNMTSNAFSVMVTAAARFKIGIAWSRLYDIEAYASQ
ncbi:hypothetical protein ACP70R_042192 [Stipagrostis hirtigluma subsp. patula]